MRATLILQFGLLSVTHNVFRNYLKFDQQIAALSIDYYIFLNKTYLNGIVAMIMSIELMIIKYSLKCLDRIHVPWRCEIGVSILV